MGIGLLLLKCTSNKNNILSNNPEITFFKKVYQRHTNFTQETNPLYFNTSIDFNKQLTVNLSKNADLISNITLKIVLPDIPQPFHSILPLGKKKFKWINKIGLGIIKYIDLEIGGILIDKQYGDWLNIYYELFRGEDNDNIYIIGDNNPELNEYSTYKNSYSLYIPLKFFFNLQPNFYIPILAITSQDIKLNIQLNSFSNCFKESPSHYFEVDTNICLYKENEYLYQNVDQNKRIGKFVCFHNKRVYYEKILGDFYIPNNNNNNYNIVGDESKFNLIPKINSIIYQDESYFNGPFPPLQDACLLINYIYLDHNERWFFLNNEHRYIVPLISNILDKNISNTKAKYNLKLNHPNKILIWRTILESNIKNNDKFNYSLFPLSNSYDDIINNCSLYINNIPRTEISHINFYNYLQNYINKLSSANNIYMYSFSCDTPNYNSNGTMNFSQIQNCYLQLNLNKNINYQNPINIKLYGINFNIIDIKNGICSLKYSI